MKHFTFTPIRFLSFRYSLYIFLQSSILDPSKWNLKKNNVMLKIQNSFRFCVHTFHCTLYPFSICPTMCTHIHFISLLWNLFSVPKLKVVWALTWYLLQIKKTSRNTDASKMWTTNQPLKTGKIWTWTYQKMR